MSAPERFRVLVVEDEPDLQTVIQLVLGTLEGWDVRVVGSGAEALSSFRNSEYDLVVLDVMMPEMDGPETLRRLRNAGHRATPVIFLTARSGEAEARTYREMGAIGVIAKPFDPLALAETVQEIWRRSPPGPS